LKITKRKESNVCVTQIKVVETIIFWLITSSTWDTHWVILTRLEDGSCIDHQKAGLAGNGRMHWLVWPYSKYWQSPTTQDTLKIIHGLVLINGLSWRHANQKHQTPLRPFLTLACLHERTPKESWISLSGKNGRMVMYEMPRDSRRRFAATCLQQVKPTTKCGTTNLNDECF